MSVGLHFRLTGRPARAAALERFLDYAAGHERVWITMLPHSGGDQAYRLRRQYRRKSPGATHHRPEGRGEINR
jgi:hypothetical protein